MNTNKEIGPGVICYFRTLMKLNKYICLARVDDFYIRKMLFNVSPQLQGNGQRHVLLLRFRTNASTVMAAVTGVNNHPCDRITGFWTMLLAFWISTIYQTADTKK